MKRHPAILLLVLLLGSLSACQPSATAVAPSTPSAIPAKPQTTESIPVTVYNDDSYPPYSYKENGGIKGIYVNILKTAFSRLDGYAVTIEPVPWKRGLEYIETGRGFAIFPPYYHPVDRPWMTYSTPILDEALTIFCNADVLKTPRPNWPQDYAGLTIGNNLGFAGIKEGQAEALAKYNITIEETAGSEANLLKVALKRIDCYANDKLSVLWELQRLKAGGKYDPGGTQAEILEGATISSEQGHLGYTATDKGAFPYKADFVAQLDKILTAMKDSGEIQKIVDQFISQP